ncbi:hypothetical protein AAC387_Pa07g2441 [Persea americana]
MRTNSKFFRVKGISGLAQKMVETERDIAYPLVYLLLKLALTLPDEWMNDCLLAYIEKDIFNSIDDETIMQRFQNMKNRRGQL